ncbi:hypothetical protein QVD17_40272 [Tagetes erecta]|uniref:Uncharacterized protein n=1 Tax=Tagetes erecta TaxID=13708 RepID=A0AAD8JPS3_TARER|nr:hypothetical protein QVD17_40272 [Tagetes erecta]
MAWEVFLWIIFFTMNVALIASNLYQIVCLTDLEADYMNPYDSSARINAVVIPEMVVHGVCCGLFLVTGHWFLFLLTLPIMIYNTMLYTKRRHLIDVTEVFRSIDAEKKYRIVKLALYLLLFVLVIIGLVIAVVNNLIDDDEEVLHGSISYLHLLHLQHLQTEKLFPVLVYSEHHQHSPLNHTGYQFKGLKMPESRDRLSRSNNVVAEIYSRRRTSVESTGILPDNDVSDTSVIQTPFRWGATPLTGDGSGQQTSEAVSTVTTRRGVSGGRTLFGTPMTVYRRGGRSQNTPPSGSGFRRGRGGVLPAWYPRTPLREITHVVRAVERRRVRLGDDERPILGSPIATNQTAVQDFSTLEASLVTPKPTLASMMYKPSTLGKVPIILTAIANKGEVGTELLTPQKKLLDSIDIVEKVVMAELNRLKRTPSAKRAEREKKVRTLMSMR